MSFLYIDAENGKKFPLWRNFYENPGVSPRSFSGRPQKRQREKAPPERSRLSGGAWHVGWNAYALVIWADADLSISRLVPTLSKAISTRASPPMA